MPSKTNSSPSIPGLSSYSKFKGYQQNGSQKYKVTVILLTVDMNSSFLSGYLFIEGLTFKFPSLTTFFEGEIIDNKFGFDTRKWQATEQVDYQHWMRFEGFREGYLKGEYELESSDTVYMRWKEHFLVPDHSIKSIAGASFAGFYYIAFKKSTKKITGIYYHENSEWFQNLVLDFVEERSFEEYEFR